MHRKLGGTQPFASIAMLAYYMKAVCKLLFLLNGLAHMGGCIQTNSIEYTHKHVFQSTILLKVKPGRLAVGMLLVP